MNYNWRFLIPKNTLESEPYTEVKEVTYGYIKKVTIWNPAGSVGKSHLQIFYHEFQIYPLNKEWYSGEKLKVEFEDDYELYAEPYEIRFKGYNESLLYPHAFFINMVIRREEGEGEGEGIPSLVGMEGEI